MTLWIWTTSKQKTIRDAAGVLLSTISEVSIQYSDSFLPKVEEGDIILCMGNKVLTALKDIPESGLKKNATIKSLREKALSLEHTGQKGHFMFTNDPALIYTDGTAKSTILWDIKLAYRLLTTGTLKPEIGHYRFVEDYSDVIKTINHHWDETGKPLRVACDLETMGLYPYDPDKDIVSISISTAPGMADVVYFNGVTEQPVTPSYDLGKLVDHTVNNKKLHKQLKGILTSEKVKTEGANFKFDEGWMVEKWGLYSTNHKFDTTLVGSILDENRSNSLNMHSKIYTPMGGYDDEFNQTHDKGHMEAIPQEELLPYAGGDTDATLQVADKLRGELMGDKALTKFYVHVLHPSSRTFRKIESRGMFVDVAEYENLKKHVGDTLKRLEGEAFALMPRRLRLRHSAKGKGLRLSRDEVIRDFMFTGRGLNLKPEMFTEKKKEPSCALDHLKQFADVPEAAEFVKVLKEYNSAKKTMDTYITGFMKHLRPDGKFHPTVMLHRGDYRGKESGTVTGRLSIKDPAFQTIPKHTMWAKPLRKVYPAPPGMVVLNADYSQGELRVMACVANEPAMIAAYKKGIDLHLKTGAALNNITLEEALALKLAGDIKIKAIRQGGKAGNFGLIYGMQVDGFMEYARDQYGVILTHAEAEAFRDAFFAMYPGLLTYHDDYKEKAHADGFIRSPLGRIRHLPLINSFDRSIASKQERQAINSPIQATLSDMTQWAMSELDRQKPDLYMFGMTHDSISMYVPEDEVEETAVLVRDTMQNLPFEKVGWEPQLTFLADVEVGPNLGETEELLLAS